MSIDPGTDEWRDAMALKLRPAQIRSTLMAATLFQMVHEMIKDLVPVQVKRFYGYSAAEGVGWSGLELRKAEYERDVLSLDPGRRPFPASLRWLESVDALTPAQSQRLQDIYDHRHELTHELARFIIDVNSDPDVDLLVESVAIMRQLSRHWIATGIDTLEFGDPEGLTPDNVLDAPTIVLDLCLSAFLEAEA